jgi:cytochrome c-type biogenesis protein CcmF
MLLGHLGVAVCVLGVTVVQNYESEQDVRMDVGDTVTMGGFVFRFDGAQQVQGPNYTAHRGQFVVTTKDKVVTTLFPEKRIYRVQTMPMTEAGIDTGLFRDLYVSLGEPLQGGAWSVRVYYKPFVDWIWGGAVFMALGGFLAISDRRYRLVNRAASDSAPSPGATPVGSGAELKSP